MPAADHYRDYDRLWAHVAGVLDGWRDACDVLVLEGAGSPVELNLMERDLANLRPIRHVDGRWLLVGDIDRGGIFAQLAGTWQLLPAADRPRGLGAIVNRFRGDKALFADPGARLLPHAPGLAVLHHHMVAPAVAAPHLAQGVDHLGQVATFVAVTHQPCAMGAVGAVGSLFR